MSNDIQKSAFYSLALDNDTLEGSCLRIKSVPISDNKNFSIDIWYYASEKASEIISQKNGISIGIEWGKLFLMHPVTGKVFLEVPNDQLKTREWTNLFISYDGLNLNIALNGIVVNSRDIKDTALFTKGDIDIGSKFSGYIKSIRIYKGSINQSDYKKYIFQQAYSSDMSDIICFISFLEGKEKDLGPYNLNIEYIRACAIVDCIHVYSSKCQKGYGYAKLESAKINPGYSNDSFSIYAKVYLRPCDNESQVIISNGYINAIDSLVLSMEYFTYRAFKFKVKLGCNELIVDEIYKAYNWLDILVTYDKNNISIFVDGELKGRLMVKGFNRSAVGDVKVGNGFNTNNSDEAFPFGGYIASIAIFNKTLNERDATDFYENQPFIFEDGLEALFSFDKGIAADLVSEKELTLTNEGLTIAERTVTSISEKPYNYRVTKSYEDISDMNKWKVKVILAAIQGYFKECFGLDFNVEDEIPKHVQYYIYDKFRYLPEFSPIYTNEIVYDNNIINTNDESMILTNEHIANAIGKIKKVQLTNIMNLATVNTTLNTKVGGVFSISGATFASITSLATYSSIFLLLFAAPTITSMLFNGIRNLIDQYRNNKPKKEDDDKDKYTIKILELSLQSNPDDFTESAIYCQDCFGTVMPPEVVRNTESKYAVYIASELKKVKVKAKFRLEIKGEDKKDKYHVVISGYTSKSNNPIFNHLHGSGEFGEGENTIELSTSEILNISTGDIFRYNTDLSWSYKIDEYYGTDIDSNLNIYTIPCIPAPSICIDKTISEDYVILEYLDLIAQEYEISEERDNIEQLVTAQNLYKTTYRLYNSKKLRYNPAPALYVQFERYMGVSFIIFERTKFLNDMNRKTNGVIEVNCVTYAAILNYAFRLRGELNSSIIRITNRDYRILKEYTNGMPLNSDLRPANWRSNIDRNDKFKFHMVVQIPQGPRSIPLIYDASLKYYDGLREGYFSGIQYKIKPYTCNILFEDYGSYLSYVFKVGTPCTIYEKFCFVER